MQPRGKEGVKCPVCKGVGRIPDRCLTGPLVSCPECFGEKRVWGGRANEIRLQDQKYEREWEKKVIFIRTGVRPS